MEKGRVVNMKKKYFTNRFTPEEYKVYVKNNNKIFEYTAKTISYLLLKKNINYHFRGHMDITR